MHTCNYFWGFFELIQKCNFFPNYFLFWILFWTFSKHVQLWLILFFLTIFFLFFQKNNLIKVLAKIFMRLTALDTSKMSKVRSRFFLLRRPELGSQLVFKFCNANFVYTKFLSYYTNTICENIFLCIRIILNLYEKKI